MERHEAEQGPGWDGRDGMRRDGNGVGQERDGTNPNLREIRWGLVATHGIEGYGVEDGTRGT